LSPSIWSNSRPRRARRSGPQSGRWPRLISVIASVGILSGAVTIAVGSPAGAATLPADVKFEQWKISTSAFTTGSIVNEYTEGQVVPFRLDVSKVADGTYTFSVCRDFTTNPPSSVRGYLVLAPYNATVTPVIGAPITSTVGNFSGAANGGTVTVNSATEVNAQGACTNAGELETQVSVTIAGSPTDAFVVWGGHLAAPTDAGVGPGNGASQFSGASLHLELNEPSKTLPIQVAPQTTGLITVVKNAVPDTPQPFLFQAFGPTAAAVNAGNVFPLVDNGPPPPPPAPSRSRDFTVAPGTYTIGELPPAAPFVLSSVTCVSTVAGGASAGVVGPTPPFVGFASYAVRAGEHVTCTFADIIPQIPVGTLEVVKQLSPATDPGVFDLFIDGAQFATNVGHNGTTGAQTVVPGLHAVAETAGVGTILGDYAPITVRCTDALNPAAVVAAGAGPFLPNVPVAPNQHVVCVFTNTRGRGHLRVLKTLEPAADSGRFNLTIDGTVEALDVGDNGDTGLVAVDAGTHAVGETAGPSTALANYASGISCTHVVTTSAGSSEVVVRTGSGTDLSGIPVGIGDDVTCRITNVRRATITIVKDAKPNSAQDFTFTPSAGLNGGAAFLLDDDGSNVNALPDRRTFAVDPGAFTVAEAPVAGWELTSIACDDTDSTGDAGHGVATINVAPGEAVVCTFTNVKHGVYGNDPSVNPTEHPYDPTPGTGGQGAGDTGQNGVAVTQPSGGDPSAGGAGTNLTASPVADPAPGPAGNPQVQGATLGHLPRTGAAIAHQVTVGLLLIGAGLVLSVFRRRRSPPDAA